MIFHVVLTKFSTESDAAIADTFRGAMRLCGEIPELTVRCGLIDSDDAIEYQAIYEFGLKDRAAHQSFINSAALERYVAQVLPSLKDFVAYNYGEFDTSANGRT